MEERWLTVNDICKYLNVSNETDYNWVKQRNMLPGHRGGCRWCLGMGSRLRRSGQSEKG